MLKIFFVIIIIMSSSTAMLLTTSYLGMKQREIQFFDIDKRNLESIKAELINNIIDINGVKILPLGENRDGYHTLPSWLNTEKVNSYGIEYVYCPYSSIEFDTGSVDIREVNINSSDTYNVSVLNNISTNNKNYVLTSNDSHINGLIGLIISKSKNEEVFCTDVSLVNGRLVLNKSIVAGIFKDSVIYNDIKKSEFIQIGENENALQEELLKWSAKSPFKYSIELENENYILNNYSLFDNNDIEKNILIINGKSISNLVGSSADSTVTIDNATVHLLSLNTLDGLNLKFRNSNVYIKNSNISSLEFEDSIIEFDNTNIKILKAINSKIKIDDSNFNPINTQSKPIIDLFNSDIVISGLMNFNNLNSSSNIVLNKSSFTMYGDNKNFNYRGNVEIINAFNSDIAIQDSIINISRTGGQLISFLTTDVITNLSIRNTTINSNFASLTGLYVSGKTVLSGVDLNLGNETTYGIVLNDGAFVKIENTQIRNLGDNLINGIHDQGALYLTGGNNIINANNCTAGKIFDNKILKTIADKTVEVQGRGVNSVVNDITKPTSFEIDLTSNFNTFETICN